MAVLGEFVVLIYLWISCFVLEFVQSGDTYSRKVSLEYNPGLNESLRSSLNINLLHIRAVGHNDTIHYVWSTLGIPTVLVIHTAVSDSQLHVDWQKLLNENQSEAIKIEPANRVLYSTAVLFTKVFEYDDVNNTASIRKSNKIFPPYNLADFTWEDVNATLNHTTLTAVFSGRNASAAGLFKNGSISFKVSAFETTGRDGMLPRLLHSANSSKMEFVIDKVVPRGNYSRFMLEMVTVETKANHRVMKSVHSIDDEYTPSIFEMAELVAVPQNSSAIYSFAQWKVVAYQSSKYQRDDSIPCIYDKLQVMNQTFPSNSIAGAYFSETLDDYNITALNVSFGIAEGDYYKEHNFLSWSILIGCGNPLEDSFSVLVICIMAVALGTPILLMILGCIVVHILQKGKYSDYEPIN